VQAEMALALNGKVLDGDCMIGVQGTRQISRL
jgi:hypothetical protein